MAQVAEKDRITRIGCLAYDGEFYVTKCNVTIDEIYEHHSGLGVVVGNVIYPFPWYRGIDVFTEKNFKLFKKRIQESQKE